MRFDASFRLGMLATLALLIAPAHALARKEKGKDEAKPGPVVAEALPVEMTGSYRLDAGPEIRGSLVITADHRFEYHLVAGALAEDASGSWQFIGTRTCLTTEPAPVAPEWRAVPVTKGPTVRVTWPSGAGIAGIGVRVGFGDGDAADAGDLAGGYTLEDGWVLPLGEKRTPRWVELIEPVHNLASPRFPFGASGRLAVTLVPNDMDKARFDKTCADLVGTALVLRRAEGEMKFYRETR
ncbi:hypothetical protein [Novosphingobium olei]|uniref:Peptidase n=1 Tax=Novosphingobium olei TaxID=2728851 RepID=A0A7Y0GBS8_9SPHN|nr:hypothetical protein [Novosphingobium olei]NML95289.1 hypothetical protein [Novosphingobium olei]